MRRTASKVSAAIIALSVMIMLALTGCDSRAERIREINAILATPVAERTPLSAKIDTIEIRDGDCINSTLPEGISIESVVIVPCAGAWQYRVLNSFIVSETGRYPGEHTFSQQALDGCDRRSTYFLFPLEDSWSYGDRTVNCLQESFGMSVTDPSRLDSIVSTSRLKVGDCYKEIPDVNDEVVELIDCSSNWKFRVINSFNVTTSGSYPGEDVFSQWASKRCDRRSSIFLFPLEDSWSYGDRTVNCIQDSFGLSIGDPDKLDRLVDADSISSGECFNQAPETNNLLVELVACSGAWEFQVINTFDVTTLDKYPGSSGFSQKASERCEQKHDSIWYPSNESWESGDRTVLCLRRNRNP